MPKLYQAFFWTLWILRDTIHKGPDLIDSWQETDKKQVCTKHGHLREGESKFLNRNKRECDGEGGQWSNIKHCDSKQLILVNHEDP